MRALALLVASLVSTLACNSERGTAPVPPASNATAPAPIVPPTRGGDVSVVADDGKNLAATLYDAGDQAPAAVFVHSLEVDRTEWSGVVERLVKAPRRYTLMTYDRRGHGASAKLETDAPEAAIERHRADLRSVIEHVQKAASPRAVVLVGSSFGAALAASVAEGQSNVSALGLLSPGQAISGLDLLKPYARIRDVPTFVAAASDDAVSREPLEILARMNAAAAVKTYPGKAHGAAALARQEPVFWSDLEGWLMTVFDQAPRQNRSLDFAPGLEPSAAAPVARQRSAGKARERTGGGR